MTLYKYLFLAHLAANNQRTLFAPLAFETFDLLGKFRFLLGLLRLGFLAGGKGVMLFLKQANYVFVSLDAELGDLELLFAA